MYFFSPKIEQIELSFSQKNLRRSLSFCSLFQSKRGNLKISKLERSCNLNKVIENTETPENVLEDIKETDSNMERLSVVVNEIEEFERQFIHPMNKSVSSLSISETSRQRRYKTSHSKWHNKYNSSNNLESSKARRKFHSSLESVISDYDSGAYSRESTPDFSLMSSIPDVSEPLISPRLVMSYSNATKDVQVDKIEETDESEASPINIVYYPKQSQVSLRPVTFTEVVFSSNYQPKFERFSTLTKKGGESLESLNILCSTPKHHKKPNLSKSQSLHWTKSPTVLKRSTTSVGSSSSMSVSMGTTTDNAQCSSHCKSEVTVNGLCYH